nr:SGNH/GDSL hydrolase family protein [Microlunatus panaciterrae]
MLDAQSTFLFTGDSVTDCGRREDVDRQLGHGYVRVLTSLWSEAAPTVINTGIGGNRAVDLQGRLQSDVLDHRPDLVSILIGINDTWRRYDSDDPTTVESYESSYRAILQQVAAQGSQLVLIEPFLLAIDDDQHGWREDLDPKIEAVHRLASEFSAILVPADTELNRIAKKGGPAALAADGVHPTPLGHVELAQLWHRTVIKEAG